MIHADRLSVSRLTRRHLLHSAAAVPLAAILRPDRAAAQELDRFVTALETARKVAANLESQITAATFPISADTAATWQGLDFNGRLGLAESAVGLPLDTLQPYVIERHFVLYDAMIGLEIPPIPSPEAVQRIPTGQTPAPDNCPDAVALAWEVFLDALGLLDEAEIIKAVLHEAAQDDVAEIEQAVQTGDIDRFIDGCKNVVTLFGEKTILEMFLQRAGRKGFSKILAKLSLRMIPWVGWGYALAALGLSIHRHWPEITCNRSSE